MNTYLGKEEIMGNGVVAKEVLNIDEAIGKFIRTEEDMIAVGEDNNDSGFKKMNIKGMDIIIEDVIRIGGLYLFCKTEEGFAFAIRPDELEKFEEITDRKRPYSTEDYEKAKKQGLDLDNWDDYTQFFSLGEFDENYGTWIGR